MPGMSGYDVCRQLKENEATRDIPIIFISALGKEYEEAKGFELGGVDYIIKPVSPAIVKARVQTHLTLKESLSLQTAQNEKLLELSRLKDKILGIVAHDLRNPIATIQGMSDTLLELPLDETARQRFLTIIFETSRQMSSMVDDLLDVSAIECGFFSLHKEPGDLTAMLQGWMEKAIWIAKNKGIQLETDFQEIDSFSFDARRLEQATDNLFSNAVKFSLPGTTVRVHCRADGNRCVIAVADQGPGMPPGDVDQLFEAFRKLSAKPTGDEKSSGLGLMIVKKIVDAHGGEVLVESQPGKGSTFTISLPLL